MESKRTLKIARGAREVARARGSRISSNEIPETTNRFSNSNNPGKGRSRVMGHVGVAVRRDDASRTMTTYDDRFGDQDDDDNANDNHNHNDNNNDDDDDTDGAYTPYIDDTQGPSLYGSRQTNNFLPSPALADHNPNDDGTTIDLTGDNPQPKAGSKQPSPSFSDSDDSSASQEGRPHPTVERQSLASWLIPAPSPEMAASASSSAKSKKRRRQQQHEHLPLQEEADNPAVPSSRTDRKRRTWAAFSRGRGESGRPGGSEGDGTLSAWLEPPPPSRKKSRTQQKEDGWLDSSALGNRGFVGHEHDDGGSGDRDDSGKWMSDRLEGLDPSGAARAKDSWTDRERRNLTCTDIALGAKRKSRGGGGRSRGWKTKAGGSKVFVEAGSGVVASGRAAYRKTKRGGGGGGGVRKKRRG